MKAIPFLFLFLLTFELLPPSKAQTVGNGTVIAPSAGQRENYGLNTIQESQAETAFPTRHYKRGNSSGIGGSFLQTTSPTSESSPAASPSAPTQTRSIQFRLPKLDSIFSDGTNNPALDTFAPNLSNLPTVRPFAGITGSSPSFSPHSSQSGLNSIPSFSTRPTPMEQMQFDSFEKH